MPNYTENITNYRFSCYQKFVDLFCILFKREIDEDRSLPSFSVFHTYSVENFRREVTYVCFPNSRLFMLLVFRIPHKSSRFSAARESVV